MEQPSTGRQLDAPANPYEGICSINLVAITSRTQLAWFTFDFYYSFNSPSVLSFIIDLKIISIFNLRAIISLLIHSFSTQATFFHSFQSSVYSLTWIQPSNRGLLLIKHKHPFMWRTFKDDINIWDQYGDTIKQKMKKKKRRRRRRIRKRKR